MHALAICCRPDAPTKSRSMNTRSLFLALAFAVSPAMAEAAPDDETPAVIIDGGHWQADSREGTYRIQIESVGFEHVSCRVWIEWLTTAAPGAPSQLLARVPFAEASNGMWACKQGAVDTPLQDNVLTIPAVHTYSNAPRVFKAALGNPGEYEVLTP